MSGDPQLVAGLVANLVDDALRHSTADGAVEITTTPAGCLWIGDPGPVIDPGELDITVCSPAHPDALRQQPG